MKTNCELRQVSNTLVIEHLPLNDMLQHHRAVLTKARNDYGNNSSEVAQAEENVGICLLGLGEFRKAIPYIEQAILILESIPKSSQSHIAHLLTKLSYCYRKIGNHPYAIELATRALFLYKIMNGKDVETSVTRYNIGKCYFEIGNYKIAAQYFNRALTRNTPHKVIIQRATKVCGEKLQNDYVKEVDMLYV